MRIMILTCVFVGCVFALATSYAASPQFVAEIPFDSCKGMICVKARMDGEDPLTLLLDTGDALNIISVERAKSYGWSLQPHIGRNGKTSPGVFDTGSHTLTLGGVSQPTTFMALSSADLGSQGLYEGSLVYTFFRDRILQIDYPHHLLRVSAVLSGDTEGVKARGRLSIVNFHTWGPPIVTGGPFTINGKQVQAQIDTGFTGTMLIYTKAIASLGLSEIAKRQGLNEVFPFTDGGVTMKAVKAQREGFADSVIEAKSPLVYFPTPKVHEPDSPFDATVGNAFFKNCIVTLDFHDMTLEVQRDVRGG
jgi:hypothetical protein